MNLCVYLADQNPHRDRSLGITNMTNDLLSELAGRDEVQLRTVISKSSYSFTSQRVFSTKFPWKTDHAIGRILTDNVHPLFCSKRNVDIWLYPKGFLPFFLRPRSPCVGIIHDTIPFWYNEHYPEQVRGLASRYFLSLMKRSMARFDVILTISLSAKNQILSICDRFCLVPPPIHVVYESVRYEKDQAETEKGDYVLHLASVAPHKKTEWLLKIWGDALREGRDLPPLKLVGKVPPDAMGLVENHPGIEVLPHLSEDDFKCCMAKARALILPSEIEGFGLPAVEAYCLGTPVCYVKGTAVDEILGIVNGTGGFDLECPDSLFTSLDNILAMPTSAVCCARDEIRKKYSVRVFADRVLDVISNI